MALLRMRLGTHWWHPPYWTAVGQPSPREAGKHWGAVVRLGEQTGSLSIFAGSALMWSKPEEQVKTGLEIASGWGQGFPY